MLTLLSTLLLSGCPVQDEALAATADRIEAGYFDAAIGREIADEVRRWRTTGRYQASCGRDEEFAARLQRDLSVFDGHLRVDRSAPGSAGTMESLERWRASAREANAGVRQVQVLEGNVGYLRLTSFYSWDLAQPKLTHALSLLADVEGLILDLRRNGGGDGETAGHLTRALLPGEIASVFDLDTRNGREPQPLPSPALPSVAASIPVVVLIDRRTGSAAEAVAYSLQSRRRATLVGERTGGDAHMLGDPIALPHGFVLGVPEARPVDLVTGGNWEQAGVSPDVPGGDDPLHVARNLIEARPGGSR